MQKLGLGILSSSSQAITQPCRLFGEMHMAFKITLKFAL